MILWDQRCEVEKNKKQSYFTHSLFFLILGKMDNPPFHFINAKIYSSVFGLMFSFYLNHYAKRFHFSDDFNWNAIRYMQAVADEIVLLNIDPQKVCCCFLILKLVSCKHLFLVPCQLSKTYVSFSLPRHGIWQSFWMNLSV